MPEVYATARGPLARLAEPVRASAPGAVATRASSRSSRLPPEARMLDVGCGALGLRGLEPELDDHRRRPGRAARLSGPVRARRRRRGAAVRRRRVRPRLLLQRDRARRAGAARRRSRRSCGASAAAGTCRRRPSRSRSSRTRCCRARSGCPPALRRRYWRLGAAGDWEDISLLRRARARAAVRPGAAPSASGRSSRAGSASASS